MDREAVHEWLIQTLAVSRETLDCLDALVARVLEEAKQQNLISAATIPDIWRRHVLDSAQLHLHASGDTWLDVGAGAGFPGLVNAAIARRNHVLVEPRRIRADFLARVASDLGLPVQVRQTSVERVDDIRPDVITARAVAPAPKLIQATRHLAGPSTTWLLHGGRSVADHGYELIPSLTAPDSFLVRITSASPVR